MPDPRPAQQIGELLTQSGVPSNHSLDIAQRLLTLADSSQVQTDSSSREITSDQARSSSFRNRFRSKEQTAIDGEDGRNGKDGLRGYNGTGVDGKDGESGQDGETGQAGRDGEVDLTGLTGIIYGLLPGLLDKILNCQWFRKKARECLPDISTPPSLPCSPAIKGDIRCCDNKGTASGKSVCSSIDQISKELTRLRERIDKCCGNPDIVRWLCDTQTGTCSQQVVANESIGFETKAECENACKNGGVIRWYCNTNTRVCDEGLGNANDLGYARKDQCEAACAAIGPPDPRGGPGTELKKLLAAMGYVATENCPCNARAREMDENGVQWVRDNTETVIDWLEEQARERGSWLFTRAGAAALIETACLLAGSDAQRSDPAT